MTSQLTEGPDAATPAEPVADMPAADMPGGRRSAGILDRPVNRLVLFAGALVVVLLGGLGVGRLTAGDASGTPAGAVGGVADHSHAPGEPAHDHGVVAEDAGHGDDHGTESGSGHDHSGEGTSGSGNPGDSEVGGLAVSQAGFRLVPETATLPAGDRRDFRFQVRGADGLPVTRFAVRHEKPLHLIVVRRDFAGYQHLHPTMAADGTWSVPLSLSEPGIWRAYADFAAPDASGTEHEVTLGVDLVAAGNFAPRPLPPAGREATVDGLTVTFEGSPRVGATQPLLFRVLSAGGAPVTDLQPYLGAYGHLVALREGDLGYVHVHPEEELANGAVKFWLAAPSTGSYRLFFDFQVGGVVRTAEFTLTVS